MTLFWGLLYLFVDKIGKCWVGVDNYVLSAEISFYFIFGNNNCEVFWVFLLLTLHLGRKDLLKIEDYDLNCGIKKVRQKNFF